MATIGSPTTTEVPKEDWKFGYDSNGITKTHIIVTLPNQNATIDYQNHIWGFMSGICVHQYDKEIETSKYFCIGCYDQKHIKNYAEFINGKFYAPTLHDCYRTYARDTDRDQANLEEKHTIYLKIFAAFSSSTYSFAKPRHQEFSLPTPILRYMILNPHTSSMYDKLVKSCKWFYGKNKLSICETNKVVKVSCDIEIVIPSGIFKWRLQPLTETDNDELDLED